jgi:hypothetical protein
LSVKRKNINTERVFSRVLIDFVFQPRCVGSCGLKTGGESSRSAPLISERSHKNSNDPPAPCVITMSDLKRQSAEIHRHSRRHFAKETSQPLIGSGATLWILGRHKRERAARANNSRLIGKWNSRRRALFAPHAQFLTRSPRPRANFCSRDSRFLNTQSVCQLCTALFANNKVKQERAAAKREEPRLFPSISPVL